MTISKALNMYDIRKQLNSNNENPAGKQLSISDITDIDPALY